MFPTLDIDSEAGQCYHSEPERISNYRNSVAFIDSEVEALLSCQGKRKIRYFLPILISYLYVHIIKTNA